jgi:molybdopterin molybdotransferase
VLELEEALARTLEVMPAPIAEVLPVANATGRILTHPITSPHPLPLFDNSAMDGYAVSSADVSSATRETPVTLKLAGRIEAGQSPSVEVVPGSCVRIFTGSALPPGADAVVMQEDTELRAEQLAVLDVVKPWENIRFAGEDVKAGALLAQAGDRLTPTRAALLAATGCGEVRVARQPSAAVLATGSELRSPGEVLASGQIYESNRSMIASLLSPAGAKVTTYPIVPDSLEATRTTLKEAFEKHDLVLTSGGVSVGEMDFVKAAFEEIGGSLEFWKVNIRPGRPFVFGRLGNKFLFGLPGNPVSALVTFLLLVRPAVLRWQGATEVLLPRYSATLGESFTNSGERRHFVRVRVDNRGEVVSAGVQASHILSSLASANALLDMPPRSEWELGKTVQVLRWG